MLLLLSFFGCKTDKENKPQIEMGTEFSSCDPLDTSLCAFPFPSSFFTVDNQDTPSGHRINFGETTLPINQNDIQPSPRFWNERDGFSPLSPILTFFPDVDLSGVIGHDRLDTYTDSDVKTVILDLETLERVPHFVELDMSHDMDDRRAFILRPAQPLVWGHRYVVGIRNLDHTDGSPIQASEAFEMLRDGIETQDFDIEGRRQLYDEELFPALDSTGFNQEELILAWDFVVASKEAVTGKAVAMRDDMLARLPEGGPSYVIDELVEFTPEENVHTARRIYGTMTVPYYTEDPRPGFVLSRDENNMPMYMGETQRDFTVIVPRSLWDNGLSGPILQYGHGLMGSQSEVQSGYLAEMADRYGYVLIANDWSGMAHDDLDQIMLMIVNDIQNFAIIPERSQQGFVEFAAAMRMISGDLAFDSALMTTDINGEPVSVVDTDTRYYYGNSQGGILGTPYTALSTDIDRAVLGVTGAPYSLLLSRSVDFDSYFLLLKTMYADDYLQITLWLGLMQTLWDSGEPSGYLDSIKSDPLPNTNPKEVLMQVAIGDAQVTTLGAHVQARGIGAVLMPDPVREVWGLDIANDGELGSGLVEWDYGIDEPFISVPPEKETDPHGRPRKEFLAQEQLNHFLQTGELVNYCEGPCINIGD